MLKNRSVIFVVVCFLSCFVGSSTFSMGTPPNVLFLAIDDQNDWVGCLGGHANANTPNLDRLAQRGTLFTNAHCQAPLCNPSRTSLMLGLRPSTTGVYGLSPWFRDCSEWSERVTLAQHFGRNDYLTAIGGKIFHPGNRPKNFEREFEVWGPMSSIGVVPPQKLIPETPNGNHPLMDWGSFPHRDEEKGDYHVASWAIEQLQKLPRDKPFFLAAGFFLPHVPCYATESWFDSLPVDDSVLPVLLDGDRDDTPRFSWYLHWQLPEPRWSWIREHQQGVPLVRSYLACTRFVDAQIGRILDALKQEGLEDNTIVIVWSDHGWHLGEKGITGKNSLWERSTRVPLIFAGPGIDEGATCPWPVELLDIYPTLIELCNLPLRHDLEGISLVPQLTDASTFRERPAITTHNQGNHSVRSRDWRYIRYADGSEELYDHRRDPHEHRNLAAEQQWTEILEQHRRWLPAIDVPPVPGSAHRILTYSAERQEAMWEGTVIQPTDSIQK